MSSVLSPLNQQMAVLPLWAQVLVASRMVRRAWLALPEPYPKERDGVGEALDAIDSCVERGSIGVVEHRAMLAASDMRDWPSRDFFSLREAVFWAVDGCRAARDAESFPSDAAVTRAAVQAIATLQDNRVYVSVQIHALASVDLDSLAFSVKEARLMAYSPLTEEVLCRLPATCALSLTPNVRRASRG